MPDRTIDTLTMDAPKKKTRTLYVAEREFRGHPGLWGEHVVRLRVCEARPTPKGYSVPSPPGDPYPYRHGRVLIDRALRRRTGPGTTPAFDCFFAAADTPAQAAGTLAANLEDAAEEREGLSHGPYDDINRWTAAAYRTAAAHLRDGIAELDRGAVEWSRAWPGKMPAVNPDPSPDA